MDASRFFHRLRLCSGRNPQFPTSALANPESPSSHDLLFIRYPLPGHRWVYLLELVSNFMSITKLWSIFFTKNISIRYNGRQWELHGPENPRILSGIANTSKYACDELGRFRFSFDDNSSSRGMLQLFHWWTVAFWWFRLSDPRILW